MRADKLTGVPITPSRGRVWVLVALVLGAPWVYPMISHAQESICAEVKIEIKQELTLERQAFDAMMRINNGLDTQSLNNINVAVSFADEDGNGVIASSNPDDTDASFFIRVDTMQGITDITGNGTVAPASSAEILRL